MEHIPLASKTILDWEDVPAASNYIVEVNRTKYFDFESDIYNTSESILELNDLEKNKHYYWRVTPYNHLQFCLGEFISELADFNTDLENAVQEIEAISKVLVSPNPVNSEMNIDISTSEKIELKISIINTIGHIVYTTQKSLNGNNQFSIKVDTLAKGIYFLKLDSNNESTIKKIVIQ